MKVLFISTDASAIVGLGPSLVGLLRGLDRERIEPLVICPRPGRDEISILPDLKAMGVAVLERHVELWMLPPSQWGVRHATRLLGGWRERVWGFARVIEDYRIDLVYTNAVTCVDAAIAARRCNRPHVWHIRECVRGNSDLRGYVPARVIEEVIQRLSSRIVVNSHFLAKELRGTPRKVEIVHNGVNLDRFRASGKESVLHGALGLDPETPIVGTVGTIAPRKGQDTFLEAAARISAIKPEVHYVIVGGEVRSYRAALEGLVRSLGLSSQVHFLPPRGDIPELLGSLDVLVLPSKQETFGRVIVEAMGMGKPVVATRAGGPAEIVDDGKTGFLVPVGDPARMAERVLDLLSSCDLRKRFGEAGRVRALEFFSEEQYVRRMEMIFEKVVEEWRGLKGIG